MFELPPYPGRGIAVHRHHDGGLEWIYFLTGRSDGSRRRVLHAEDDRVLVVPADEAAAPDPLRHYACVRLVDAHLVIGNGDHVDVLAAAIATGTPLTLAVADVRPEPDAPIFTPRIAMVAPSIVDPDGVDVIAARTTATAAAATATTTTTTTTTTPDDGDDDVDGDGDVERTLTTVVPRTGDGLVIHTYGGDVEVVTVDARPQRFDAGGPGTDVAGRLWHALDPDLRVALAVGLAPSPIPERVLTERQA